MKEKLKAYSILFAVYALLILTLTGGTLLSHLGFFDEGSYVSCVSGADGTRFSFSEHSFYLPNRGFRNAGDLFLRVGAINRVYLPDAAVCGAAGTYEVAKECYAPFLSLLTQDDFQKND